MLGFKSMYFQVKYAAFIYDSCRKKNLSFVADKYNKG